MKNLKPESTTNSINSVLLKYLVDLCKINYRRSLKITLYIIVNVAKYVKNLNFQSLNQNFEISLEEFKHKIPRNVR